MERLALLPSWARWFAAPLLLLGLLLGYSKFVLGVQLRWLEFRVFVVIATYFRSRKFEWITTNLTEELSLLALLSGVYVLAFSRGKPQSLEDVTLRLRALHTAFWFNGAALAVADLCIFGTSFLYVLVLELYMMPLLYLVIYQVMQFRMKRRLKKAALPTCVTASHRTSLS
jgi:hypothetical protein